MKQRLENKNYRKGANMFEMKKKQNYLTYLTAMVWISKTVNVSKKKKGIWNINKLLNGSEGEKMQIGVIDMKISKKWQLNADVSQT